MVNKKYQQNVIKSIIFLLMALMLILLDLFRNFHITGIQFFSILFIIYLPRVLLKVIKSEDVFGALLINLYIIIYSLFFYLSVYYIFIPAFSFCKTGGIMTFLLINVGFLISSAIGFGIVCIPLLIETENQIIQTIIYGLTIVLSIASALILYSLGCSLLSWGFEDKYQNFIIENSPHLMVSLMNFLFK